MSSVAVTELDRTRSPNSELGIPVAQGSIFPEPERPGSVPAPFDPEEVVTSSQCREVLGDWECDCPPGSKNPTFKLHFDDGIATGEGRHWDYTDCDGNTWKIFEDGTMIPAR